MKIIPLSMDWDKKEEIESNKKVKTPLPWWN